MKIRLTILGLIFIGNFCYSQKTEAPRDEVYRYYDSVVNRNILHENFIGSYQKHAENLGLMKNFDSVSKLYYDLAVKNKKDNNYALSKYYLSKVVYKLNNGKLGESEYYNDLFYELAKKTNNKTDQLIALKRYIGVANLLGDTTNFNKYVQVVLPDLENFDKLVQSENFLYPNIRSYIHIINYIFGNYQKLNDSVALKNFYSIFDKILQFVDTSKIILPIDKKEFKRSEILAKIIYNSIIPNTFKEDFYQIIDNYFIDSVYKNNPSGNYDAARMYMVMAIKNKDVEAIDKAYKLFDKYVFSVRLFNTEKFRMIFDAYKLHYSNQYKAANEKLFAITDTQEDEYSLFKLQHFQNEKETYINKMKMLTSHENEVIALEKKAQFQKLMYLVIGISAILIIACIALYQYKKRKLEKERLFLAQCIHDEVAPLINFMRQSLDNYNRKNEIPSEVYADLNTQFTGVANIVRQVSHEINNNKKYTTENLRTAIKKLVDSIVRISGKEINFEFDIPNIQISFTQFHRLKLMVTEMISNTIKHAKFQTIDLIMKYENKKIEIYYKDDGLGFINYAAGNDGIGVKNLYYHSAILRGTISLNNNYPQGYFYNITIPLS